MLETKEEIALKRVSRFAMSVFIKIAAGMAALFVLICVAIPQLVNAHDDTLGVLGLVLGLLTPALLGWVAASVFISTRRFINQPREGE